MRWCSGWWSTVLFSKGADKKARGEWTTLLARHVWISTKDLFSPCAQEFYRGTLGELAESYRLTEVKGEITLVIGPSDDQITENAPDSTLIRKLLKNHLLEGESPSMAAKIVAKELGVGRQQIYQASIEEARKTSVDARITWGYCEPRRAICCKYQDWVEASIYAAKVYDSSWTDRDLKDLTMLCDTILWSCGGNGEFHLHVDEEGLLNKCSQVWPLATKLGWIVVPWNKNAAGSKWQSILQKLSPFAPHIEVEQIAPVWFCSRREQHSFCRSTNCRQIFSWTD